MWVGRVSAVIAAVLVGACGRAESAADLVRDRAARDHGWDVDVVEIGRLSELDRAGCQFFRASNPRVLDAWSYTYVLLPDDELAGKPSAATAARVLRDCGTDADATWQAEVVTDFSGAVPGIVVDAENVGSAERLIRETGAEYFPPRSGDGTVTFYARNFDVGSIHLVEATLPPDGDVVVTTQPIVTSR